MHISVFEYARYELTTAEILYHMPDQLSLLQTYIWQELDKSPDFPHLKKFLEFWEKNLDGPLHSVRVASVRVAEPKEIVHFDKSFRVH